jgi:hypothetical protein
VRREKAEKLKKLEALGLVQPGKNIIFLFISYGTFKHKINWPLFVWNRWWVQESPQPSVPLPNCCKGSRCIQYQAQCLQEGESRVQFPFQTAARDPDVFNTKLNAFKKVSPGISSPSRLLPGIQMYSIPSSMPSRRWVQGSVPLPDCCQGSRLCRWFRFAQLAKGKKFRP